MKAHELTEEWPDNLPTSACESGDVADEMIKRYRLAINGYGDGDGYGYSNGDGDGDGNGNGDGLWNISLGT